MVPWRAQAAGNDRLAVVLTARAQLWMQQVADEQTQRASISQAAAVGACRGAVIGLVRAC